MAELLIQKTANELRTALSQLRTRIKKGDSSSLFCWAIPNALACCQRPLRDDPNFGCSRKVFPIEARDLVIQLVAQVQRQGIKSIICLSHPKELAYYEPLKLHPKGLLGYLKEQGIEVAHLPWADPEHDTEAGSTFAETLTLIREQALAEFQRMPKPCLMFCSAAIDRTPPVAAYIVHAIKVSK